MPCTGGSLQLRDQTWISRIAGRFITAEPPGKPRLGWDWNQICHLTEKQILCSPRKELVSCKLLLLEATLNLRLCLPFQTLPALSGPQAPSLHLQMGNGNSLGSESVTARLQNSSPKTAWGQGHLLLQLRA